MTDQLMDNMYAHDEVVPIHRDDLRFLLIEAQATIEVLDTIRDDPVQWERVVANGFEADFESDYGRLRHIVGLYGAACGV